MTVTELEQRAAVPPREMRRSSPFTLTRDAEERNGDGLTLDGWASVFNRLTVIDSWEGRFREKVASGSMKKSFRENPPVIQFDHGSHPMVGSIPIAAPADGYPREEIDPEHAPEGGAHIIARLHDNWLIQPVRDAVASRSIPGMSFRFGVIGESWTDPDGKQIRDERTLRQLLERAWMEDLPEDQLLIRTLKELRVPEMGPVVWPAYVETSVGVRSMTIDLGKLHEPETRRTLARAVFLADAADQQTDDDAPPSTEPAAGHASDSTDEPQSTDVLSAGEHPSAETPKRRDLRTEASRYRGYLLTTQTKD